MSDDELENLLLTNVPEFGTPPDITFDFDTFASEAENFYTDDVIEAEVVE